MLIKNIISVIEDFAPLSFQEDYDNSGIQIGDILDEVTAVLICVDVTEEVIDEAINLNTNFIISHHPLIFSGIKKITNKTSLEKAIIKAIRNKITIYSAHTNLDNIQKGVNGIIADKIGLINKAILLPKKNSLSKLVTFIPVDHIDNVRNAVFNAGAGNIGNYDLCSYNTEGTGTFRGNKNTNPYVGEKGKLHKENEIRFESIFPNYLKNNILKSLIEAHPYEEVAYDIYPLTNDYMLAGSGMIGNLKEKIEEQEFLQKIKNIFSSGCIRYTKLLGKPINRVALCGGSGSFLLPSAIKNKADVFISADFKYHQFFEAENKILIADVGHYESEQFTKDIFYNLLTKNFSTFAIHLSKNNTNPINYL